MKMKINQILAESMAHVKKWHIFEISFHKHALRQKDWDKHVELCDNQHCPPLSEKQITLT
jgi:hypothetical protein